MKVVKAFLQGGPLDGLNMSVAETDMEIWGITPGDDDPDTWMKTVTGEPGPLANYRRAKYVMNGPLFYSISGDKCARIFEFHREYAPGERDGKYVL